MRPSMLSIPESDTSEVFSLSLRTRGWFSALATKTTVLPSACATSSFSPARNCESSAPLCVRVCLYACVYVCLLFGSMDL